jgi:hypothetical protein
MWVSSKFCSHIFLSLTTLDANLVSHQSDPLGGAKKAAFPVISSKISPQEASDYEVPSAISPVAAA